MVHDPYIRKEKMTLLIMNFNAIFTIVASLSFTIDFYNSNEFYQDFFLFNGANSSAHLYRENDTLILYLNQLNDFEIYNFYNIPYYFTFSWVNFTVNGIEMQCVKNSTKIKNINFTDYTFCSPIIDIYTSCKHEPVFKTFDKLNEINYGYIVLISLFVGIFIKSKFISLELYRKIFLLFNEYHKPESDYATMNKLDVGTQENISEP